MLYNYTCDACENKVTVSKAMAHHNREEKCDKCAAVMRKEFSSPSISTGDGAKSGGSSDVRRTIHR